MANTLLFDTPTYPLTDRNEKTVKSLISGILIWSTILFSRHLVLVLDVSGSTFDMPSSYIIVYAKYSI